MPLSSFSNKPESVLQITCEPIKALLLATSHHNHRRYLNAMLANVWSACAFFSCTYFSYFVRYSACVLLALGLNIEMY